MRPILWALGLALLVAVGGIVSNCSGDSDNVTITVKSGKL